MINLKTAKALGLTIPPSLPKYNRRPLSSEIADLLQYGDREGRYTSRSEVVMAIALGCANAG